MIGLIGTFLVELVTKEFIHYTIYLHKHVMFAALLVLYSSFSRFDRLFQVLNKGILHMIGVEVGKGLDLPL